MKPLDFTVIHLEDNAHDRTSLRKLRSELIKALATFCTDAFEGFRISDLNVSIVSVATPDDMMQHLVVVDTSEGRPVIRSAVGNVLLFVIDYYLDAAQDVDRDIRHLPMPAPFERMSVEEWLDALFPAAPKILLTSAEAREADTRWHSLQKSVLDSPNEFRREIVSLFERYWLPEFWLELRKHAQTSQKSWHTPGHNHGAAFSRSAFQRDFHEAFGGSHGDMAFAADLSVSVPALGDLSEPDIDSPLTRARRRASTLFGAADTFFITNGTSTSNKAMLMAMLQPGEAVLLDRNCHKSVHQAVVLTGAVPVYLPSAWNATLSIWAPVPPDLIAFCLDACVDCGLVVRLLVLTTSTYEGVLYPLDIISGLCEERGILLYADEAWAPYLRFHPYYGRCVDGRWVAHCATQSGAHFVAQSTHKALAAFSQASMVHVTTRFVDLLDSSAEEWRWLSERFGGTYTAFRHHLLEILRYWHSTSPHYPMLATLERAGIQMGLEGLGLIEERLHWAESVRKAVGSAWVCLTDIVGERQLARFSGFSKDPLKILLAFASEDAGRAFLRALKAEGIGWEKETPACVELLLTIGTFKNHIDALERVILKQAACLRKESRPVCIEHGVAEGQVVASPRDAAFGQAELVELSHSVGRVAAQMVVPYPPGIPVVMPGLRISTRMADGIRDAVSGGGATTVHGLSMASPHGHMRVLTPRVEQAVVAAFETHAARLAAFDQRVSILRARWT
jgi:arginine/lysine/ornithine decarboxylase